MLKRSTTLVTVTILLGLIALSFLILEETGAKIPLNGVMCNHSSTDIWLTVTESSGRKASPLPPGRCTNFLTQDAEAIWGRECSSDPCQYQAWKLGAGRFEVYNDGDSPSGFVLHIRGWGAGSRWRITPEWPKPELSTIGYSLVR